MTKRWAALVLCVWPVSAQAATVVCEERWRDASRDRIVPVRVRMPAGADAVPVVLFSHGLGGSLNAGTDWADAWATQGIATIHLQHAGSDQATWQAATGPGASLAALRAGASAEQAAARVGDVRFVLDELGRRSGETLKGGCVLKRVDRNRIGMAGHSFGAVTTQAVAGQRFAQGKIARDMRIKAAIAFSPSPSQTLADDQAFGAIDVPFLSITGTADTTPLLGRTTAPDRLRPFAAMPPGGKYLLNFDAADHAIFNGQAPRRAAASVDAHVRRVTTEVTTSFWRAYLRDDAASRAWLRERQGAVALLAPGDIFRSK